MYFGPNGLALALVGKLSRRDMDVAKRMKLFPQPIINTIYIKCLPKKTFPPPSKRAFCQGYVVIVRYVLIRNSEVIRAPR